MVTPQQERRIAFACLLAGIAFFLAWEWFGVPREIRYRFVSAPIGLGITLLILTLLIILIAVVRWSGRTVTRQAWWLAVPIVLLALDLVWYANETVLALAPVGAVILLLALGARLVAEHPGTVTGSLLPFRVAWDVVRTIPGLAQLPVLLVAHEQGRWKAVLRDVAVGTVIAIPFIVIFALLFSQANTAFGDVLERLLDEEVWRAITRRIPHVIVALGISGYLTALLLVPRAERKDGGGARTEISPRIAVPFFVLLDALFLVFIIFQAIEVFGGADGFTYAARARRGFFELMVAAAFAGLLALAWYRTIRRGEDGSAIRAALAAILAFLALTFLVAASSLERLWTYGFVYGLTLQRVYATAIVVTTMVGLGVLAHHLLRAFPFDRVTRHVSMLAVIAFTVMMTLPIERIVAEWNASARIRGQATVPFDASYIARMSPDAWPALFPIAAREAAVASVARNLSCFASSRDNQFSYYASWRRSPYWQSYHLAHRVCDRLPAMQAALRAGGTQP